MVNDTDSGSSGWSTYNDIITVTMNYAWSYDTGDGHVTSVATSADGEYIVAGIGNTDKKVYLFDKDSSTPLWSYQTSSVHSLSISADGEYITVGSTNFNTYLLFSVRLYPRSQFTKK